MDVLKALIYDFFFFSLLWEKKKITDFFDNFLYFL